MRPAPLIPPHEAPPSAWRKSGFSWQRTFSGAVIGGSIAIAAFLLDASPWWWLAVVVGFCLGASVRVDVSVLWGRK